MQSASQVTARVSLGDSYRRTHNLQIQYGVRLDANRFSTAPTFNPELERLFGERNDRAPNRLYASPRIGFSWNYGTAPTIAGFEGAVRGPRAVVRGGIGVFQGLPAATSIGSAIDNTGLAGALQQITCVGAAVPTPDWAAYAAISSTIPSRCADGSTGSVFASDAPNVTLFARDFAAPRSVRSNLNWNGPILGNRFNATVDVTWSRNLNQASTLDLNFKPAQQFTLADEGDRPVYVQPTSIVPATGAIASRDARVSQLFNRVSELRSDLRSETKQLRVGISPGDRSTNSSPGRSTTRSPTSASSTAASRAPPAIRSPSTGRAAAANRAIRSRTTLGYNLFDAVRVNWFGQFRSGTPFTPTISGDVNGDGYANDRAFVFDPASASDPAVASAMRSLLENGSGPAKDCLARQLGTLAVAQFAVVVRGRRART